MSKETVRRAASAEDLAAMHALRWAVFVQEQGVPPELESDELDAAAVQAIAVADGAVVGAGRVALLTGGEARVGRMAVRAEARRRGVGGRVLRFLEEAAMAAGAVQVTLHAQRHAAAFYRAHGYTEEGAPFLEAGIEHVMMRKRMSTGGVDGAAQP